MKDRAQAQAFTATVDADDEQAPGGQDEEAAELVIDHRIAHCADADQQRNQRVANVGGVAERNLQQQVGRARPIEVQRAAQRENQRGGHDQDDPRDGDQCDQLTLELQARRIEEDRRRQADIEHDQVERRRGVFRDDTKAVERVADRQQDEDDRKGGKDRHR
jgi:hypothetical protein